MNLYHLTLRPPTHITHYCGGSFSNCDNNEIVIVKGSFIELWSLRKGKDGGGHYMNSEGPPLNLHCHILSISTLKRKSPLCDLLVLGTDIGSLLLMEWKFGSFHSITTPSPASLSLPFPPWGRTGIRPLSPGAHLACDSKGRVIFTAALQTIKLAFLVDEKDSSISSPLEHTTSNTLTITTCSVDTGYENPLFLTIEMDSSLKRTLNVWEVDLGLRSLVLLRTTVIPQSSSFILVLPNQKSILVGSLNLIEEYDIDNLTSPPLHSKSFTGIPVKGLVLSSAKGDNLPLILGEDGTIFLYPLMNRWAKVDNDNYLNSCMYFFPSGYMFMGESSGHPRVWKVTTLEGNNCITLIESNKEEKESLIYDSLSSSSSSSLITLGPRNLSSYNPLHGFGSTTLSVIASSPIPSNAINLWTINGYNNAKTCFIIITYPSRSLILSVGEDGVNEWEGKFIGGGGGGQITLCKGTSKELVIIEGLIVKLVNLQEDIILDSFDLQEEPIHSSSNLSQTIISFKDERMLLLESFNGKIKKLSEQNASSSSTSTIITALAIQPLSAGHLRERFCCQAVMVKKRFFIRSLSLETLSILSMQEIGSRSDSILFNEDGSLHCALNNGVHLLLKISTIDGLINEQGGGSKMDIVSNSKIAVSSMLCGSLLIPVILAPKDENIIVPAYLCVNGSLIPLIIKENNEEESNGGDDDDSLGGGRGEEEDGEEEVVVAAAAPIVDKEKFQKSPLTNVAPFESGDGKGGLVGLSGNTLIIGISESPLNYPTVKEYFPITPGSLKIVNAFDGRFCLLNSLHSSISLYSEGGGKELFSFNVKNNDETGRIHLSCACFFEIEKHLERELLLAVQCLSSYTPIPPRSWKDSWIMVFKVDGNSLIHLHSTAIEKGDDNSAHSMIGFGGRLLVGMDSGIIRLFELGKKRLLRRCEYRLSDLCGSILSLSTIGWRVAVCTQHRSIHLLHYHDIDNRFQPLVDDCIPRKMGTVRPIFLDYNTICAVDRLGTFFILSLSSPSLKKEPLLDKDGQPILRTEDLLQISQLNEVKQELFLLGRSGSSLNGAPLKWKSDVEWYLGCQTISSMHLIKGNIVYTTLEGSIGVFCPIKSGSRIKELKSIETQLKSPSGRFISSWRGYYQPERGIIDGDLLEVGQKVFENSSSDLLSLLRGMREMVNFNKK